MIFACAGLLLWRWRAAKISSQSDTTKVSRISDLEPDGIPILLQSDYVSHQSGQEESV